MANKIFRTLDQQISILKSKGLVVNNETFARKILFRENYYFLSGYRHLFMKHYKSDRYITGTTFEELYAMFVFDRKIRNTFFKNILIVENNMKSIISYQLSKKYGFRETDYLNPRNFTGDTLKNRQVKDVLNKIKRQVHKNGNQHAATSHYIDNYGYIPLWVLVKVLSLGIIAELYSILKVEDQINIAKFYDIEASTLDLYLDLLSNFRNVCAHEDILYDHRTQNSIPSNKYHSYLNIPEDEDGYIYGKNDLFALVIILKIMLTKEEFNEMIDEISKEVKELDDAVNAVPLEDILNKIGFPKNWYDIKEIE